MDVPLSIFGEGFFCQVDDIEDDGDSDAGDRFI